MPRDAISVPPSPRQFESPSGKHILVLTNLPDRLRTSAELFQIGARAPSGRQLVWRQVLPHERGPREALVTDDGMVVLVDEWINVVSVRAVTVLGVDGRAVAQYPAEQLFAMLSVPRRSISSAAKFGIWMSHEPALSQDGRSVEFRSAGKRLTLTLSDGRMTVSD
jgi:hypothetical protein